VYVSNDVEKSYSLLLLPMRRCECNFRFEKRSGIIFPSVLIESPEAASVVEDDEGIGEGSREQEGS